MTKYEEVLKMLLIIMVIMAIVSPLIIKENFRFTRRWFNDLDNTKLDNVSDSVDRHNN